MPFVVGTCKLELFIFRFLPQAERLEKSEKKCAEENTEKASENNSRAQKISETEKGVRE